MYAFLSLLKTLLFLTKERHYIIFFIYILCTKHWQKPIKNMLSLDRRVTEAGLQWERVGDRCGTC